MRIIPVNIDFVRFGEPLPYPLVKKDGTLLARQAYVIESREELDEILEREGDLYYDLTHAQTQRRGYAGSKGVRVEQDDRLDWLNLQAVANTLLRDAQAESFSDRLTRLLRQLQRHSQLNPDGTLFGLIYLSATDARMYSATHAMLVSVMCGLAAKDVLNWPADDQTLVMQAALTMNVSMTELQDRLALQAEPLFADQRAAIDSHAQRSAEQLRSMGITDPDWLEAVQGHHTQIPGPLGERSRAQRIARLIQRADMFSARLSPRAARVPISPAAAMQACYFDEKKAIDEAGAALIKAVGIYQPGAYVRLATDEIAVVIKRGLNTTTPRVAVLINRNGLPIVDPILRDTSTKEHRIVASVPHREVKVDLNLERLLPLTTGPTSDTLG